MTGKLFLGREDTGPALLKGIDLVADSVAPTLGPGGRTVIVQRTDASPLITSSGLRISESVELVRDPFLNQGVQVMRDAARTVHAEVGDGSTCALLVSRVITREALRRVAAGVSPVALRAAIDDAVELACDWIRAQAVPIAGASQLASIAGSAARSEEWGELIAEALGKVGQNGVVSIEDSRKYGVGLSFRDGMSFENGMIAPGLATDPVRRETVLDNPYVLVAGERLTEVSQLAPALKAVAAERVGLLVIADEISGDALSMLLLNVKHRRIPAVAVRAPLFGPDREAALEDIAVYTGGQVFGTHVGQLTRSARLATLGRAERVTVGTDRTAIIAGAGDPAAIARRRREIEMEIEYLASAYEQEKRRQRCAWLGGSIAVIRVGRDTNTEQEETRNRLIAGVQAARASLAGGVVPGGGTTMFKSAAAITAASGDEEIGRSVVRHALQAPLRQIALNAGIDPASAVSRVQEAPADHGLDVTTDRVVDLWSAGILDAADVVCSVLKVAASLGGTCVLASGIVCERPLPPMRRRSHGHHHGSDGGHFGPVASTEAANAHRHEHEHAHDHGHSHGDDHAHDRDGTHDLDPGAHPEPIGV